VTHFYDAIFTDGITTYTVPGFTTPNEADQFGTDHHCDQLDYTGHAERRTPRDLERLIATMQLTHAAHTDTRRWIGVITRWDLGARWGFITGADGSTWSAMTVNLPTGHDRLDVDTKVTFAGNPHPAPGRKYPCAYTIRPCEEP
jgi:hypothetical protein